MNPRVRARTRARVDRVARATTGMNNLPLTHRQTTGHPETCSCILREAWPTVDEWPAGQMLSHGSGAFCDFTTVLAMRRGHLECLKYAVERGCSFHRATLWERAETHGQMECLKYALGCGVKVDKEALHICARGRIVPCLKLLIEHARPYYDFTRVRKSRKSFIGDVCYNAAPGDDSIACVKLLRGVGAPWREDCTEDAALKGHLDLLKYLVEEGCPWHERTLEAAEKNGNAQLLDFVRQHTKKRKHRAHVSTMFDVIEKNKRNMTEQEYIDACRAAKELHDAV